MSFFFLVNQEEHPHVVCQRRRRRPCSSASQGGLILTTSWCEGAFVTAGKFLTLRGVGRDVRAGCHGRLTGVGFKHSQPPQVRLICQHCPLITRRSDTTQILNFLLWGCEDVKRVFTREDCFS